MQRLTAPQLAQVPRLCPGFTPDGPPQRTATSVLQPGVLHGRRVLAKAPTDPRPWWRDRCRHEITIYRAFAEHGPPPLTVPQLVAADPHAPLLVLTHLPGVAPHPDRYLAPGRLPPADLRRHLTLLAALHTWPPAQPSAVPDDSDYPAQLAGLTDVLTPDDIQSASALHAAARTPLQISHGDAHPANTLSTAEDLALIDFEFTGWRPAGYDHAKLWIFARADPAARAAVQADLGTGPLMLAGFWTAVVLVAAREIRSHRHHTDLPQRVERLAGLTADLRHALTNVRALQPPHPTREAPWTCP